MSKPVRYREWKDLDLAPDPAVVVVRVETAKLKAAGRLVLIAAATWLAASVYYTPVYVDYNDGRSWPGEDRQRGSRAVWIEPGTTGSAVLASGDAITISNNTFSGGGETFIVWGGEYGKGKR